MAKQSYKIPADLDATYGDMEIAIQSKNGVGAKPLPVKVILTYIGSIMLLFYVCTHGIISHGSFGQIVIFAILWLILTVQLARFDKTKRMRVQLLPVLLDYLPKASRHMLTRTSAKANPFFALVGIKNIDKRTGMIEFNDSTYGYMYRVVGSASVLLFDEDKEAILNRVDSFYRKIGVDCECIFITTKEAQKVYRQISSLKRKYDALTTNDPDLLRIADESFDVLKNFVGTSFKSTHQYLIIKGDNREALSANKNVLQSEYENSSLMIKQCTPLYYEDIVGDENTTGVLASIYKGCDI